MVLKMATALDNDICYEKFGTPGHTQIATSLEKSNFKPNQNFHFRISQIYDLTKFWIVIKYRELEVFQKHLFKYYYVSKQKYKIPEDGIEKNMYCIVCTDGGYYRGIVVGFPIDYLEHSEVQIYFYDYGMLKTVDPCNILYMSRTHLLVPQFAVRASLGGIAPKNYLQWTVDDVNEFSNLVCDRILIGKILSIDEDRQVLELCCSPLLDNGDFGTTINDILILQNRARYIFKEGTFQEDDSLLEPKLQFPYLFPCHEAIESGKVCSNLGDADYQLQISPFSTLVTRYYRNKECDS